VRGEGVLCEYPPLTLKPRASSLFEHVIALFAIRYLPSQAIDYEAVTAFVFFCADFCSIFRFKSEYRHQLERSAFYREAHHIAKREKQNCDLLLVLSNIDLLQYA